MLKTIPNKPMMDGPELKAEAARANFERITVLCPPNAQGKRGLWLLDDPREFTV